MGRAAVKGQGVQAAARQGVSVAGPWGQMTGAGRILLRSLVSEDAI